MPAKSKLLMQRLPRGSCAWTPPRERLSPLGAHRKSVGQVLVPRPSLTRSRVIPGPLSPVRERDVTSGVNFI
jgi:hypothetical protein